MSVLSHSFRSLFLGNCLPSRESRQPVSAQPPCINLSVKSSRSKLKLCESVSGPGLSHQTIQVHHVHTLYATVSCKTIYYTVIIWYMVWIIFHHSARIRILEYLRQLLHLLHRRFLRFGHGLQMGFISNILLIHWNFMSLNKYERIALVILVCFWRGTNPFQRSLKDKGKKQPKRQGLFSRHFGPRRLPSFGLELPRHIERHQIISCLKHPFGVAHCSCRDMHFFAEAWGARQVSEKNVWLEVASDSSKAINIHFFAFGILCSCVYLSPFLGRDSELRFRINSLTRTVKYWEQCSHLPTYK